MAGYSGTPLVKKLGFKPQMRCSFVSPPKNWLVTLGLLPGETKVLSRPAKPLDLCIAFCVSQADLNSVLRRVRPLLSPAGAVWIAWPKKSSGVETELSDSVVRSAGLKARLVDVKVCAIDDIWSGLKFVIPVALRVEDRK